jgi:hypothetical protein
MQETGFASSALARYLPPIQELSAIDMFITDSGGPGTYSQLLILKEYMSRLATDLNVSEDDIYPADHFDLMGGVGFGGYASHLILVLWALKLCPQTGCSYTWAFSHERQ